MEEESSIKNALTTSIVLVLIGTLLPIIAIFMPWRPEGEQLAAWFQRSGSVMVFVAVWAELKLIAIHSNVNPSGWVTESAGALNEKYGARYNRVSAVVAILAAMGALIWGYGDLLIGNA